MVLSFDVYIAVTQRKGNAFIMTVIIVMSSPNCNADCVSKENVNVFSHTGTLLIVSKGKA